MNQPKAKRVKLPSTIAQGFHYYPVDDQSNEIKRKSLKLPAANGQMVKIDPVVEQSDEFRPSLFSLNDDCCLAIFELLPLNDLCAISKTCIRFQGLSKDVYRRRYKSKVLIIESILHDGNMICGPNEQYTKYFAEFIQNVSLGQGVASKPGLEILKAFYRLKEKNYYASSNNGESIDNNVKKNEGLISTPIRTLRFESWRTGLRKCHGAVLADIVQDVESVTFSNIKVVGDLNQNILQFMPKIKMLTLWKALDEPNDNEVNWMEQSYRKLDYFAWHLKRKVSVKQLKRFFQVNSTIQTFSLWSKSRNTISALITESICTDELFFDMPSDILAAFDELRRLCSTQMGKQVKLHLMFSDSVRTALNQNLKQLATLAPYIEGLYFENVFVDKDLVKVIAKCEHLKMIQLNFPAEKKIRWMIHVPKLEEIFVYRGVSISNFSKYHKVMLMLVGQMRNLKKIYIRNNSRGFHDFGLDQLDAERRKLTGAPKLKIHIKTNETSSTGRWNETVCEFDKIEAVRVESESFNNPLVTESLTTKGLQGRYERYIQLLPRLTS